MEYRYILAFRCWYFPSCCRCSCSYWYCFRRFRSYALELTVSELERRCQLSYHRSLDLSTSNHQQPVAARTISVGSSGVHVTMTALHDHELEQWHFVFGYVCGKQVMFERRRRNFFFGLDWNERRKEGNWLKVEKKRRKKREKKYENFVVTRHSRNKLEHRRRLLFRLQSTITYHYFSEEYHHIIIIE